MSLFQTKSCFIITGASRGIGRSIAINFAKKTNIDSVLLLMSRNTCALESVKDEIESCRPKVKVFVHQFDQGIPDESLLEKVFSKYQLIKEDYEQVMIVHNAATLGDNSKFARDFIDIEELNNYFTTNLTGTILLNNSFMNFFTQDQLPKRFIVNMSSYAALNPTKNTSLYCTGKAAREMFFKVLAAEESSVRVLSYSPGAVDTDMLVQLRDKTGNPELQRHISSLYKEKQVLDCDTTAKKLIQILEDDTFVSGSHVDYSDQ